MDDDPLCDMETDKAAVTIPNPRTGIIVMLNGSPGDIIKVGEFPLSALGRARSMGKTLGFVKILADPESSLILGVAIVGEHASELISEGTLAIEMGACLEDLIVSIHPHPTFSESLMEAAEMAATGSVHMLKTNK